MFSAVGRSQAAGKSSGAEARKQRKSGRDRASPWVALAVITAGLALTLIVWRAIASRETAQIHRNANSHAMHARNLVASALEDQIQEIFRRAFRWQSWPVDPGTELFRAYESLHGFRGIAWTDSSGRPRLVIQNQQNGGAIDFSRIDPSELRLAEERGLMIAQASKLTGRSGSYAVYARAAGSSEKRGFIVAVFAAQELLETILREDEIPGFAITISDNRREIYRRPGADPRYEQWAESSLVSLKDVSWVIRAWPQPDRMKEIATSGDELVLALGVLFSLLCGGVAYLAQTARAHAREAQESAELLRQETIERQHIHEQLRKSEEALRILVDTASDAIITVDSTGVILSFNHEAERMFGYAAGEVIDHPLTFLIPERLRSSAQSRFAAFIASPQGTKKSEYYARRRDEREFPVEISAASWNAQEATRVTFIVRDITERTENEEKLRRSEERYRAIFDNARDAIALATKDGLFAAVNPGFEAITGWAAKECVGRPFTDFIHPDDLPVMLGIWGRLLDGADPSIIELRYLTKTGDCRIAELNASGCRRNGEVLEVVAIGRDITQRRRAEQQLQLQLERISVLREIGFTVTSTLDLGSVVNSLVEQTKKLLSYSAVVVWLLDRTTGEARPIAVNGLHQGEFMHTQPRSMPRFVRSAVESKKPVYARDTQARSAGAADFTSQEIVAGLAVPLFRRDETVGAMVFLTDEEHIFADDEIAFLSALTGEAAIAIRNSQLHEQTTRQAAELEAASRRQADFSAMIAHDLRSPLSNIMNVAQMIREEMLGPVTADQGLWLERIEKNAAGLVDLVSDFLDVARIESGHVEISRAPMDLEQMVRGAVANFLPVASKRNINLTCLAPTPIPRVCADGRRLEQVVTNLVGNAVKFTAPGGAIRVTLRAESDHVRVEVADTGAGIAKQELATLFEKYRQTGSGRASSQRGTGLGLAVSKMIIQAHGGEITADSEEGKGSVFSFTVPVEKRKPPQANGREVVPCN